MVPAGRALAAAVQWASELGERSAGAWRQIMRLTELAEERSLHAYLQAEEEAYTAWFPTAHAQAGIRTFLNRRQTYAAEAGGGCGDGE